MNIDEKAINNFLDYLLNQKNFSKILLEHTKQILWNLIFI